MLSFIHVYVAEYLNMVKHICLLNDVFYCFLTKTPKILLSGLLKHSTLYYDALARQNVFCCLTVA